MVTQKEEASIVDVLRRCCYPYGDTSLDEAAEPSDSSLNDQPTDPSTPAALLQYTTKNASKDSAAGDGPSCPTTTPVQL